MGWPLSLEPHTKGDSGRGRWGSGDPVGGDGGACEGSATAQGTWASAVVGGPGRGTRAHGPRQGRSNNRFLFSVSKSEAMCVIARERGKVNPRPAVPALRPQHEAAFHFARSLSF